ncbi:MAG: DNA phosphorothioation-associated protein 4 [Nostoc sp. DedVER02]|uniref:DNA phosphorothioation-associated protein 4 n=1 Tax=unclassified Nostoc TaxID=2593658 RepID=UPI002AD4EBAD|nr:MULTISPECIES: DNA phosphorothioation-associated protein 4 [unclassified Nostoc]MDZ7987650.1 DNA phosphorothioation-associated protein 4 [Nostoc sp. DedVER02]MDZ8114195.1 DNA phosphorothioation-associated protein 4 [Nostoc sp. DedVER01b]
MPANRIKIAKDKAELVKSLVASKDTTGPFQTYVEVMVFAAALGVKQKKRVPLEGIAKDLSPLRQDYFASSFILLINLLSITETKDIRIIGDDDLADEQRIHIFEEYANGGLEILQNKLHGAVDYSERLLLVLSSERFKEEQHEEEFDLSKFLA